MSQERENILTFPVRSEKKADTRMFDGAYKKARDEHKTLCFNERDGRIPEWFMTLLLQAWHKLYGRKR